MSIELLSQNILRSTPTRMALKGGVETNNRVMSAVAKELREFLTQYKGKHISVEDLEGFYKKYFPDAKLLIINGISPQRNNGVSIAESSVNYSDDMKSIEEFLMFIHAKSTKDKLKWLFTGKQNDKQFYVDNKFIKVYLHEYVHFMQRYLKPIDVAVNNAISSHAYGIPGNFIHIQNDIIMADRDLVYRYERGKFFAPEEFRKTLLQHLRTPYYANEMLVKDELKFLIRHAQSEKQAYEIELEEGAWLSHPIIMKNKYYRAYRQNRNRKVLNNAYRFDDKIRVMKEEYFKIINAERERMRELHRVFD